MKPSKFNEAQIIDILREAEAGAKTADLCRRHPRQVRALSPVPRLQGDRRCDEGMPGRRGRHFDFGTSGGAGAHRRDRKARKTGLDRQRSWNRVHFERDAGMDRGS